MHVFITRREVLQARLHVSCDFDNGFHKKCRRRSCPSEEVCMTKVCMEYLLICLETFTRLIRGHSQQL